MPIRQHTSHHPSETLRSIRYVLGTFAGTYAHEGFQAHLDFNGVYISSIQKWRTHFEREMWTYHIMQPHPQANTANKSNENLLPGVHNPPVLISRWHGLLVCSLIPADEQDSHHFRLLTRVTLMHFILDARIRVMHPGWREIQAAFNLTREQSILLQGNFTTVYAFFLFLFHCLRLHKKYLAGLAKWICGHGSAQLSILWFKRCTVLKISSRFQCWKVQL